MIQDDTHDKLLKSVLEYLAINEEFERRPSHRTKRLSRGKLRDVMRLAKARQDEIQAHYNVVLKELKANQK